MLRHYLALVGAGLLLVLIGCGGNGPKIIREDTFIVGSNQPFSQTFGQIGIEISPGTFPFGSENTLVQSSSTANLPSTDNFVLGHPALKLSSSSIAEHDITVMIPDDGRHYLACSRNGDRWEPLASSKTNGQIHFTLPASLGQRRSDGAGQIWEWLIGLVKDNLPDPGFGVHLVAGSGPLGADSAIIVHGILDNYQSMTRLAEMLRPRMGWRNVYSLAYDGHLGTAETSNYLAGLLTPLESSPKSIDLIGHSRGSIIIRYTLEKLQKTKAVRSAYFFCGPHLGGTGTVSDIWFALTREWFNDDYPVAPPETITGPVFDELIPNNAFLTDLNTYSFSQRGHVNYYLIAGSDDNVVGTDSALANGVALEELTGGTIRRLVLEGATHGSVKNRTSDINQFLTLIGLLSNPLQLWVDPNPVDADVDGWRFTFKLRNISLNPIVINNLTLDQFNKDGDWYACQWYDPNTPNGQLFPNRYSNWNKLLQPGEETERLMKLRTTNNNDPISSIPLIWQARTVVVTAELDQNTGTSSGTAITNVVCHYANIWPSAPLVRRPAGNITPNKGLIGN